jgi:GNAT superfamily N-acetyltransferase
VSDPKSRRVRFEPLEKHHDRAAFSCVKHPSLDVFLKTQALQQAKKMYSATYVLVAEESPDTIIGYYSLSSTSVLLDRTPASLASRLPRFPDIPATLLARLAVDHQFQGQGYGSQLLIDALLGSYIGGKRIGSAAVIVDAIDDDAKRFYEKYGFVPFEDEPYQLYLPMQAVEALLKQVGLVS